MENIQQAKLKAQSHLMSIIVPCKVSHQGNYFLIDLSTTKNASVFQPKDYYPEFLSHKTHCLQFITPNEVFNLPGKIETDTENLQQNKLRFIADDSEDYQNYSGAQSERA